MSFPYHSGVTPEHLSFGSQTQWQTKAPVVTNQDIPDLQSKSQTKRSGPICETRAEPPARSTAGTKGAGREGG